MKRKLALVFGGTRGIGEATVMKLAEQGFDVAFTYVKSTPTTAKQIAITLQGYKVDICEFQEVKSTFAKVAKDFGRSIDCVVANAGINVPLCPIAQFDAETFRKVVNVNLVGAFHVLTEAAKHVADHGTIIGLTTSMVRTNVPGGGPYTATKAGVESLLRSMSKELAYRGIRVNGVAPGPVDTDMFHAGKTDEIKVRAAALSPFNRIGRPEEVAEVITFLASDKASWINGQIIQPNGGMIWTLLKRL